MSPLAFWRGLFCSLGQRLGYDGLIYEPIAAVDKKGAKQPETHGVFMPWVFCWQKGREIMPAEMWRTDTERKKNTKFAYSLKTERVKEKDFP
jgi:hypothetical protein